MSPEHDALVLRVVDGVSLALGARLDGVAAELRQKLADVSQQLRDMKNDRADCRVTHETKMKTLETRQTKVEKWQYLVVGGGILAGAILVVFVNVVSAHVLSDLNNGLKPAAAPPIVQSVRPGGGKP